MTYQQVESDLKSAPTMKALIERAQQIQHVEGITNQNNLGRIVKARLDELKGRK